MRTPHLVAGLLAGLVLVAALITGQLYADGVESQYIHALAPLVFGQKTLGAALQRQVFRQPDLLPIYGGSELRDGAAYGGGAFFKNAPTGFMLAPIGLHAAGSLNSLQELASNASELRGKKVVISLTADYFLLPVSLPAYQFNFSILHANELAWSSDLSLGVRQGAARRMLQYPRTTQKDPLLQFGLKSLADGSPLSLAVYSALVPLGKLHNLVLRGQDHWETLNYIWGKKDLDPIVSREVSEPDWPALLSRAEQESQQKSTNNPFGIANGLWNRYNGAWTKEKGTLSDKKFQDLLEKSTEWTDLELLLRELKEQGAEPLVLSMPLHGAFYDYRGVSSVARKAYYEKLRRVAQSYGVALVVFEDHESDKYFLADVFGHVSSKGWVYYDEVLDSFYHGTLD